MGFTIKSEGSKRAARFQSDELTLGGVFQCPEGQGSFPIVVLGHGLNGLKEWTLPDVAAALVEKGIAAFRFDYRNYGDSEGTPRDEVSHHGRIQDWQNAITYVTTLPNVDEERIGVWGTSLGGRDVLAFSWLDRRVKAVVAQAPLIKWTLQSAAAMAGYKDDIAGFQADLAADRKNRALGKEPKYLDFVRPSGDDVKAAFIAQLSEAERRHYSGRITLQSYQPTTLIDVTPFVELLAPTPVLFVLAEQDFLPGQREAHEAAKGPKWLARVPGNHFSPYVESKEQSIAVARDFFVRVLLEGRTEFELGQP
ncbi:putative 31.7 kDa protein in traX-finO intergenic region [Cyphellophora attinorum]|uniref:Putative 31.7 kDa protein in traX-finO intergenic region n=1 Tax=Cyphellophora attinorum TaxID=1664694 RepID=A0A0N1HR90_9EURO|nr:putative 31.7 kDa protein in traX-finO intergenic region [Phialophora attinorum]KPI40700.1 putative 31.7 kDa protein in traX-finO intergenic region [Phialophora attinorum]